MQTKAKNSSIYLLSFIIPIIILFLVYMLIGIYPAGDKSILFRDLDGQYISYFSELRNTILGNGSFAYSFSKEIGGGMVGLEAYYLMSPLNILLILFPKSMITEAVIIIILLKIGFCGLTFFIFLKNSFRNFGYYTLIFTTAYALMSYNIVYQTNIMWLDGVAMLPLVIIGIENIIYKNKSLMYIITLALSIIFNFYIGFIICIFSLIYFLYKVFIHLNKNKLKFKDFFCKFLRFSFSSVISALLSSVVIVPTIYALMGGKAKFEFFTMPFRVNYNFFDIVSRFYISGLGDRDILKGLPNIYCGIFIALLAVLYLFNKNISKFEKGSSIVVVLILLVSFYINKIDYIWHGFNKPVGFPYRYSFVFSFFIMMLAYKSYLNLKYINKNIISILFLAICGISVLMIREKYKYLSILNIMISLISCALYCLFIVVKKKSNYRNTVVLCLLITTILELGISSTSILKDIKFKSRSGFINYVNDTESVINFIKNNDDTFYRIGKTFKYNNNDPMLLNYNGLSHFSSVYKVYISNFMKSMGFNQNNIWYAYDDGSTVIANSLLGVKYIIVKDENKDKYNDTYKFLYKYKDMNVYLNEYVLPLGFMVSNNILDFKYYKNPFDFQNELIKSMNNNIDSKMYLKIKDYNVSLKNLNLIKTDNYNEYYKVNKNKEGEIIIRFNAPNNDPLYVFLETDYIKGADIFINNKKISSISKGNYKVVPLGRYEHYAPLELKIKLKDNKFNLSNIYLESLDLKKFEEAFSNLSKNKFNIMEYKSNFIKGNVTSTKSKSILYTTIPYDEGWKVTLDGEKVETIKLMNSLMGINIPKVGKYILEFKYIPSGLYLGSTLTLLSICIILIICIYNRKYK